MSDAPLLVDREGSVAVVTLNRPHARNALEGALYTDLGTAFETLGADPAVRVIVLTGAGGAFCAGADLKSPPRGSMDETIDLVHAIIRNIVAAPKPVVAMVDGPAVGFGCDLALACDLRVLSTEGYLQEKFVKIGLMPDGGGTFWLPRLVGLGRALELMMTGRAVRADEALALGLANHVVPRAELRARTIALAADLAKGPPVAFAEMKRAVRAGAESLGEALALEKKGQLACLSSEDGKEGIAAWVEKREPVFRGR